jgi:hypothetical protein
MKRYTITICGALILLGSAGAQSVDSATMMKNWMEYMTPAKEHKLMASWDGTWTGQVSMWMSAGQPPVQSTTTAINKMVCGGRYQQSSFTGDMMGTPFEGMSTLAFDNSKKEFVSTWIDNMGTGMMISNGKWDDATKSVVLRGKMVDPSAGNGKEVAFREVLKVVDNDHQVMEMYGMDPSGKEYKSMEIKFTRNK